MSSPKVDLNWGGLASSSSKSSRSKVDEAGSSASAAATEKAKSKGKKCKSIVESDEETSKKGNEIQDKECIVVKKRKPGALLSDKGELEKKNSQENARKRKPEGQKSPSSCVSRADEVEDRGNTTSAAAPDERKQVSDSKVNLPTNVQKAGKVGMFCCLEVRFIHVLHCRRISQVLQSQLQGRWRVRRLASTQIFRHHSMHDMR